MRMRSICTANCQCRRSEHWDVPGRRGTHDSIGGHESVDLAGSHQSHVAKSKLGKRDQMMYERQPGISDGENFLTTLSLDSLIAALASRDPATYRHARQTLVRIGEGAVSSLITAMKDREDQVRWAATKALAEIASPKAAPALVSVLQDEEAGIRWLAAEGLIALGADGLEPLMQGLVDHAGSSFMREGAHHVLYELIGGPLSKLVSPVLAALDGPAPEDYAPVAAYASLETLRSGRQLESI